ncbi:Hypothetical predicted protein [Octopus vulgaris]|uniref:Uncharacterized protein n=1 Tax=Octopus vulgaris TaxID=6645 RepID=A0AA36AJF2_OCTVU|nr:Hypothetical predicted protein [Octopus vulgaris]
MRTSGWSYVHYRPVVRTPRCGCGNPGSNPGHGRSEMVSSRWEVITTLTMLGNRFFSQGSNPISKNFKYSNAVIDCSRPVNKLRAAKENASHTRIPPSLRFCGENGFFTLGIKRISNNVRVRCDMAATSV